ncbi:MAG: hydrogenase 3 maturation endopeptidase HyCI [Anaerolineales bacterium]|nr:hydrogenase 3 maturation endopeptidase HyCI [Anaerolineales bacterium]
MRKELIREGACRTAFVGVGSVLRADDAIGMDVARALLPIFAQREDVLVIEAGVAPENTTGTLRKFQPDLIVFIDAADMGEKPGAIRWLDWRDSIGLSASTHTLPLRVLAEFLTKDLGCEVGLIGIQASVIGFGQAYGRELVSVAEEIADGLKEVFFGTVRKNSLTKS